MKSNDDRTRHRLRPRVMLGDGAAVRWAAAGLVLASAAALDAARAQSRSRVDGLVVSADGARVVGAQVRVVGAAGSFALSDDSGRFEFHLLGDAGSRRLVVRRIGFRPETLSVQVPRPEGVPLEVRLVRVTQLLPSILVKGETSGMSGTSARVREQQKRSGNGYFVFRDEIENMDVAQASDVLRRIPGVRISIGSLGMTDVRLRANRCAPLYWMDGVPLGGIPFDIDQVRPSTIEALEIYPSAATVPPQWRGPLRAQGCGSIVIWTREGERRPKRASISADSIARLVDAALIFLPQEVDTVARLLTMPQPGYPDSLRRAKAAGTVIAEFIVDAKGKIVQASIGVVSSSHPFFGDAVRLALLEATFSPAMRGGHPVAQVLQLPFAFKPAADP